MFTVCPKCALTLGVTAADLRIGQGYVRCGRCSSVFNALANLNDDVQDSAAAKDAPVVRDDAPTGENPLLHFEDSALEDALPDSALEFDPQRSDPASVFIEPPADEDDLLSSGTFETIVLEGDDDLLPDEVDEPLAAAQTDAGSGAIDTLLDDDGAPLMDDPEPAPRATPGAAAPAEALRAHDATLTAAATAELLSPTPAASAAAGAHPPAEPPRPSTPPPPVIVTTAPATAATFAAELAADEPASEDEQRVQRMFSGGSVLLAGLLAVQLLHHFHEDLAAQPALHGAIAGLYAGIGMPLTTRWDVDAYEVRQLGASTTRTPGELMVGASLKNGAPRAQPCPVLRVTLQDRYGNRLAARDFDRAEYLAALPPGGMLASGQRLDTEIALVDPGQNAVGFELDACLRGAGGALHCANQARER